MTVEKEIDRLSQQLRQYQYEYYVLGSPSVTDAEYDSLFDRLRELEAANPELKKNDSPTQRVGSDLTSDFPEAEHSVPVLSLEKEYTVQGLLAWVRKVRSEENPEIVIEEKIDGVSIVLYYEVGVLTRAVTRGNGFVGNDVTANVRTIPAVPLRLSEDLTLAVRGEIYLPLKSFEKINQKMNMQYANPRNLAAGTLRRIKSSEVAKVPLTMFAYEGYFNPPLERHTEVLQKLRDLGFRINNRTGVFSQESGNIRNISEWDTGDFTDIEGFVEKERAERDSLEYEIDGLVCKVNTLSVRERLGYTGHHPRWAIAYKFDAPMGITEIQGIHVQVGRTGRITPVATVEPVKVGGSTITHATLHNQEYIDALELAIGDQVSISKRGDVIPAVEEVVQKNETGNPVWEMPKQCPSCKDSLSEIGAHLFCTNPDCPQQLRGRIRFFIDRDQMDIEGIGPETAEVLMQQGLVKDIPDLYFCDFMQLIDVPGFGEKKIRLMEKGVEKSKNAAYKKVLPSLGIPELGPKATELLIGAGYRSIDQLLELADNNNSAPLVSIHGIGEKTADSIITGLRNPRVRTIITQLKKAGLCFYAEDEDTQETDQRFADTTWCITGSFERFKPRSTAGDEIKKRGGKVTTSVSRNTDYLLAGESPGSKLAKAEGLDITIVDEEQFLRMLDNRTY